MATSKAHQKLLQQKLKEGQQFFFAEPPDLVSAATIFAELTRLAPKWAEGFFWFASAQLKQSGVAEAETTFRRAIELDPTDPRPHLWLGIGFERAGRLEEAVRCLRAGLALRPHYGEADSRMTLAGVFRKMGRIDEAVREWRVVAKMEAMYPSYDEPIHDAKRELQAYGHAV
jgi:tetratricopeptide (TPR) repeat protein